MTKFLVWTLLFFLTTNTYAKRFANGYAEFELPAGWTCIIEGSEWVCQSEDKDRKKEAIIILAAKKRGAQDTLGEYQAYLKQTKTYQLPGAKMQRSEPKTVQTNKINGQTWVDALHLASEVPGFYTRYLATVKADIGVAVTFSVTKSLYNAYKGIFDNVIASMRIFRQTNTNLAGINKGNKDENFDDTTFVPQDENVTLTATKVKKRKGSGEGEDDLLIFGLIAAVVGFALFKLKKGKSKKS
ncbi:MAG: hypothetical protein HON90_13765 [Halobacteriovoraceae bacterium]|nr:hypothetical protein [Halobacteriovoraceae bacterium]